MSDRNKQAIVACREIAKAIGFDIKGKNFNDLVEAVRKLAAKKTPKSKKTEA